jgi:Cu2+-exporting ATPase
VLPTAITDDADDGRRAEGGPARDRESPTAVVCTHCGLPVPRGLVVAGAELQFCCAGCRAVHAVIRGCGLDRYYAIREGADAAREPARTTGRRYGEYDDTTFQDLYVQSLSATVRAIEFYLEGVHCAACVWLVERLHRVVPGVLEARLDLRRSLVAVRWNADEVRLSQIARSLDSLGYPPHPAKDRNARARRRQEDRQFLIRIGVAAACAGNVMTLAFALYGGAFTGMEHEYEYLFRCASMIFGVISLAWPGSVFFRGAWAALRTRTAHLDLPIALALAAGGVAGTVNALWARGEIYFDSLTALVFLLLVGRWVQHRQQRWTADALEMLFSLTPTSARKVEGDSIQEVPIEAIGPGDLVEVRAGESLPTDGMVVEGRSALDQSLLTGESQPVAVNVGDPVHAGTVNVTSRLVIRAVAVGEHTRVGRLLRMIEDCGQRRAPLVRFADQVAGWFVLAVVCLALLTLGAWLIVEPRSAIDRAVALLIVACPCALGLATPLTISVALGQAAQKKILIKGGEVLEQLAGRGLVVLDKTGTLTAGRMSVVSWYGPPEAKQLAAALETHSSHPVALVLVAAAKQDLSVGSTPNAMVTDVEETTGGGIIGLVNGQQVLVGSARFAQARGVDIREELAEAQQRVLAAGLSPALIAVEGHCVAVAGIGDPIRADARSAIADLRRLGWQVQVLSGDHPEVVATVARQLGVDTQHAVGGTLPEGKLAFVRTAAERGTVVMVGDGINDAAALAAATVGVAVHGGAEVSLSVADVYLNCPGVDPVVELIRLARHTVRTIRCGFVLSLAYNVVAASLAAFGLIGPLGAAVLMPVSSFTVIAVAVLSPALGGRR